MLIYVSYTLVISRTTKKTWGDILRARGQGFWETGHLLKIIIARTGPARLVPPETLQVKHKVTISYLGHDVFVVVISQSTAEFVVVHVRFALSFAPATSNLVWISQLELTRGTVPRDTSRVLGVG